MYIFIPVLAALVFLAFFAFFETIAYHKLVALGLKYNPPGEIKLEKNQTLLDMAGQFLYVWMISMTSDKISMIDKEKIEQLATQEVKKIDNILAPYHYIKNLSQFCALGAVISVVIFIFVIFAQAVS